MSSQDSKPNVIVTGPAKRLRTGWWGARLMLKLCGLKGHNVTARQKHYPSNVCGVIVGGGNDINPKHYGLIGDGLARYDAERDHLELEIIKMALECDIPILGICRGAQLLNVALGGNLHQDIRPQRRLTPNRNSIFPIKIARLESTSNLHRIMRTTPVKINSLHNQAINKIGSSLQCSATDEDGFIQAVEDSRSQFLVGVQWHPEYMPYSKPQRLLFSAFAEAVRKSQNTLPALEQEPSS